MNIILYGDSFLGRFGKDRIEQLESKLTDATIFNCAAGGWNSSDLTRRVEYISQLKPDYVILSFGGNDVAPWKDIVPLEEFTNNVKLMLSAFAESKILMVQCPNVELKDPIQTQQYNNGLLLRYGHVKDLFDEAGVAVIDTNTLFAEMEDYHESDGVHFNNEAYDILVNRIAKIII